MSSLITDNASKSLVVTRQDGYDSVSPVTAFIDKALAFTGKFNLNNPYGMFWNDLVQNGSITLSVGGNSIIGGMDRVKITADGSGINVPGSWVNVGTDTITITAGKINIFYVLSVPNQIEYSVKVI